MKHHFITLFFCTTLFFACIPLDDPVLYLPGDLRPPIFLGIRQDSAESLYLDFDEEIHAVADTISIYQSSGEELGLDTHQREGAEGQSLRIDLAALPDPGERCSLELSVSDTAGNSLHLIVPFYGYNDSLPAMRINEFTTQGSSSRPDMVEIEITEAGSLAGALFCEGIDGFAEQELVFPNIQVQAGDYLVIHCKSEGSSEEINEVEDRTESGGKRACDSAWDLWIPGGSGLSGNNGVISLYARPGGSCLDAVVYSNRSSGSDTTYRGFGSRRMLELVDQVGEQGLWLGEESILRPEDAVDPEPSTATRSMFRMPGAEDTKRKGDWYIAPTSGSSFGEENGSEVYTP